MSLLGLDSGHTVKYNPLPSGVPSGFALPLGTPLGKGLYLTVYPTSRPNTDTISLTHLTLRNILHQLVWHLVLAIRGAPVKCVTL